MLLHSEWPKLYGVLAILSAIALNPYNLNCGWLADLGLTALSDSISVHMDPSPRERERKEKLLSKDKISIQSPHVPSASTVGSCPTFIKISRTPRHRKLPSNEAHCNHPNSTIIQTLLIQTLHTLKCLSIGTPKIINFPFVSNGKLMIFKCPNIQTDYNEAACTLPKFWDT